jgi:CDP-diacylglycerol---serine O-phosphatidyltransferase
MDPIIPPYEPEAPAPQKRPRASVPLRMIIPNIVTLLALGAGLTAVRFAIDGKLEYASLAILVAAVLDGLDGRIARALGGTSRFGAELDSLADFVSFGCAPALILYFWQLHSLKTLGWIVCLLIAFAMALRLARFNVMIDAPQRPEWQKAFSVGVPAPAGAMLALLPLNLSLAGLPMFSGFAVLILIWTLVTTFLTISRLPTFSGKGLKTPIGRNWVIPVLMLVVLVLSLLVSHPFETISVLTLVYVAAIPVAIRRFAAEMRAESLPKTPPAVAS